MAKIYDNNYDNLDLVIPNSIMKDQTIRGEAKLILTFLKAFTNSGTKPSQAMTKQMALLIHSTEKSVEYNLNKLHDNGHIVWDKTLVGRRNKGVIEYTYKEKVKVKETQSGTSGLF